MLRKEYSEVHGKKVVPKHGADGTLIHPETGEVLGHSPHRHTLTDTWEEHHLLRGRPSPHELAPVPDSTNVSGLTEAAHGEEDPTVPIRDFEDAEGFHVDGPVGIKGDYTKQLYPKAGGGTNIQGPEELKHGGEDRHND
jgi:hypothetical protein